MFNRVSCRTPRFLVVSAALLSPLPLLAGGCRHASRPVARAPKLLPLSAAPPPLTPDPLPAAAPTAFTPAPIPAGAEAPLPLVLTPDRRAEETIASLQKRVLGRRNSFKEIQRVADVIAPLVDQASRQQEVQSALQQMAEAVGVTPEEMRQRWVAFQEADLLLESGGDPDAVSPAKASGVAQWLAGTAQKAGLKVDVAASRNLSAQIWETKRQLAWLEYLQRPDADRNALGAPTLTPAQIGTQSPLVRTQLQTLRTQRAAIDARFDPKQAIFAQTLYLLGLYTRFPGPDWIFQAYHGGEAGVTRTLQRYLGKDWPGSADLAIRQGAAGKPLSFEQVYETATPRHHAAAFGYLYSRGDDHRHYWWKLRAAQADLALYRRDPTALKRRWESLFPGRPLPAVWYPKASKEALPNLPALQSALTAKTLIPVVSQADYNVHPLQDDPIQAAHYAALRPEALGALRLVAAAYRQCDGEGSLAVGDLTLTDDVLRKRRAELAHKRAALPKPKTPPLLWPPDSDAALLPGGGPPADFDYHSIGAAFDLIRSSDEHHRKILEYALGWFEDRGILSVLDDRNAVPRHYHIVANPRYAVALTHIVGTGKIPVLPDL